MQHGPLRLYNSTRTKKKGIYCIPHITLGNDGPIEWLKDLGMKTIYEGREKLK